MLIYPFGRKRNDYVKNLPFWVAVVVLMNKFVSVLWHTLYNVYETQNGYCTFLSCPVIQ